MANELTVNELGMVVDDGIRIQYIVIKLGNEQFGIDIKYVDNIVRMQTITRVPHVQKFIKGVINLRGEVIPVLSLRVKMGLEDVPDTKASRIVILKLEQYGLLGFVVDEVREVVTLSENQIEKTSYSGPEERQSFVAGVGKNGSELISLLDLNVVCSEK